MYAYNTFIKHWLYSRCCVYSGEKNRYKDKEICPVYTLKQLDLLHLFKHLVSADGCGIFDRE